MASSSSVTPKLIIPEEKTTSEVSGIQPTSTSSISTTNINSPSSGTVKKKLTKILSTQSSFERHPPHRIAKRFSIDADPSSVILNTPITDFSNNPLQQTLTPDCDETSLILLAKESSPARSPLLKKSDSFLEIPYEKGEIVDLIKLADDPNAAAHVVNDGHEVLLEHGSAPDDTIKSPKEASREARDSFISSRLLPGFYFAFLTACGLLGGFGFALGKTKKRETTAKLTQQVNATKLFDDGQHLAIKALRRASIYSLTGVCSFSLFLWLISGRPKTFNEFRLWTGSWLPSIKSKKPKEDEGRTEFKNLTELMQYLSDEDKKLKNNKNEKDI